METTQERVDVLNDLIQINNDRVAGFEKALADINDENVDLKELFSRYAGQSRQNIWLSESTSDSGFCQWDSAMAKRKAMSRRGSRSRSALSTALSVRRM